MRKEDFFEVLGELDDDLVKGAKTAVKKKMNGRTWGVMAACLAAAAILGVGLLQSGFVTAPNDGESVSGSDIPTHEGRTESLKPVINFEGVVAAVEDGSVTLQDGTVVLITEDTVFAGDPDTGNAVSADILVGNFIQGYTEDDSDAGEITASRIWTNEGRTGGGKRVVNFEGRVTKAERDSVTLDNGKIVKIAEDTAVTAPDGSPDEIAEGDYIQGYAENAENSEIDAVYILITTL